jgi:prepilin-type N-terminal cleavage/methylation domain-containing protein
MARPHARPGVGLGMGEAPIGAARGYSLIELMFVAGLVAVLAAAAIPAFSHGLDTYRARGAARHLSGRLQRARAEAVSRGAHVALRFSQTGAPVDFTAFVDGNRNGLSTADIAAGIDRPIGPAADLSDFPGVQFGIVPGTASPEGLPLTSDPIRFGVSRMASFTPRGTATAGSVYLRGRDGSQYVVRVYGDTGKTTTLRYERRAERWVPL